MAGVVEAVGSAVTRFRPGDEVMGETVRGIQWRHGGAWAEHVCAPEDGLVLRPASLTFDEAAAVGTPAVLAYEVLVDQAGFRAGQSVLVNGAAGAMGLWVTQLALALGASRVVGVDHTDKLDLLRSVGVHQVVDHTREDPTRLAERVDVVVDVASTRTFREWRRVLRPRRHVRPRRSRPLRRGHAPLDRQHPHGARHVAAGAVLPAAARASGARRRGPRRLEHLAQLLDEGRLRPVVDSTYPLEQVKEAFDRLTSGRAVGRIVLTV